MASEFAPRIKELRCSSDGTLRVLFMSDPRRTAILLLGGNKSGRWQEWYRAAIPTADALIVYIWKSCKRKDCSKVAGHHPLAESRAGIATDPARPERLAAARRQIAEEQAAYDEALAAVERARAATHEQLALALDVPVADVARIERHAALYLLDDAGLFAGHGR